MLEGSQVSRELGKMRFQIVADTSEKPLGADAIPLDKPHQGHGAISLAGLLVLPPCLRRAPYGSRSLLFGDLKREAKAAPEGSIIELGAAGCAGHPPALHGFALANPASASIAKGQVVLSSR